MIQLVDVSQSKPFDRSLDEIDEAILKRSHAIWTETGRPVAAPNPIGHGLRLLALVFGALAIAGMAITFAGLALPETWLKWLVEQVPGHQRVVSKEYRFTLGISGFLTAFVSVFLAAAFAIKGERMLRRAPQLADRATSAKNIGRRRWLWASALVLIVAGIWLFSLPFVRMFTGVPIEISQRYFIEMGLSALGVLMFVWGAWRIAKAVHLAKPSAAELRNKDPRPPIVLLRSFRDDDLRIARERTNSKGESTTEFVRLEEAVADQFEPYGPLIAIGRPGETLPTLGAARDYYSDADWKAAVQAWMDKAQFIVLIPGLTPGLGWELDEIEKRGYLGKMMILMPPAVGTWTEHTRATPVVGAVLGLLSKAVTGTDIAEAARVNLQRRWSVIRDALQDVSAFAGLPEAAPDGAIVLCLGRDLTPTVVVGPTNAEETHFEHAIRLGVYNMFCH
jgi:hypothetical protein